ncbi:hypothetical protein BKA70DRAFT_1257175 [Coprinopsis sp. MPI-PUGE-AT-0042]|nr:hypothetical protein BKA70DRAFT_1257175 [Coprinopsis sp. MPI-PUGE-AT-0042]
MSPFAATLRRCVAGPSTPRVTAVTRKARSKNKSAAGQLPPEKLRALIALYHQSDSFINEDNLLEKINDALIRKTSQQYMEQYREPTVDTLNDAVRARKTTPKFTQISVKHDSGISSGQWGFVRNLRDREVAGAMYGLDGSSNAQKPKPGLELVQDASTDAPAKGS